MSSITESYTRINRTTAEPGSNSDLDTRAYSIYRSPVLVRFILLCGAATMILLFFLFLWPDKPGQKSKPDMAKEPPLSSKHAESAFLQNKTVSQPQPRPAETGPPPALPKDPPTGEKIALNLYKPPVLVSESSDPNSDLSSATPPEEKGFSAQAYFRAGMVAESQGLSNQAIELFKKAIQLDNDHPEAYLRLGNIFLFQRQDMEQAQKMYREVVRIDQNNKIAYNNIGVTYLHQERYGKAEANFTAALKRDPEYVDALYNLACSAARQGRYDQAMENLLAAGRIKPEVAAWAAEDQDFQALKGNPTFEDFTRPRDIPQEQD